MNLWTSLAEILILLAGSFGLGYALAQGSFRRSLAQLRADIRAAEAQLTTLPTDATPVANGNGVASAGQTTPLPGDEPDSLRSGAPAW